jgi:methylphosphotriester-DNA--protein-cysteine methyltransferase
MINHNDITSRILFRKIKNKQISFAGNKKLRIYGTLHCTSGKRMRKENRVFFSSEKEAVESGYRPCGHCMKKTYQDWSRRISSEKRSILG